MIRNLKNDMLFYNQSKFKTSLSLQLAGNLQVKV